MKSASLAAFAVPLLAPGAVHAQFGGDFSCQRGGCKNFTQKLNHDRPDDKTTFQQRYVMDTTHFKAGGPILFHQNEETPLTSDTIVGHVFSDYAERLGALHVSLEHRYFGYSYPEGLSLAMDMAGNITVAQYAPLTLDNVFGDSITFLTWLRATVPGAKDSPIIYGGGSYGGSLAILARAQHRDFFAGALSFSPACKSWGGSRTLQQNPYKFAASDWVAQLYWDADADVARKIRSSLMQLDRCIKANDCNTTLPDLKQSG